MNDKHTPGPWKASEGDTNIPDCEGAWGDVKEDGDHYAIATIWADTDELEVEAKANARLIAAAPDLLAACRAALSQMCNTVAPSTSFTDVVDMLDAAISKATESK